MNSLSPHIIFPPQYSSSVYTTFILLVPIQKALRPLTCLLNSQPGTVISLCHHWTPPIHLIYRKQPSNQSPQFIPHKYSRTVFLKQATHGSEFPPSTTLMINSSLWHFILQHMVPYQHPIPSPPPLLYSPAILGSLLSPKGSPFSQNPAIQVIFAQTVSSVLNLLSLPQKAIKKCTHSLNTAFSKYIFRSAPSGYGSFFYLNMLVFHSYLRESTHHSPLCSTALSVVPGPSTRLGVPQRHEHFLTYLN